MIRRVGFTTRATCLLAAGATAILCGLLFGEVDLVRAGVLAAAIPCVAAVATHRSRVRIANRRRVEPLQAQAGHPVTVHLTITNQSMLRTSALMLEDRLPDHVVGRARFVVDALAARETRMVSYRIPSLGRGHYRVGPLSMRVSDPFGLIDLTRSFSATNDFVVTPMIEPLPTANPPRSDDMGDNAGSRSVGSHGADDQSTREYRIGDDLRKIHWRSSARTGSLMVRQEERPWQGHSTLVLDVRAGAHAQTASAPDAAVDPRTASSFEWAVSALASFGTHLLAGGRKISLVADASPTERVGYAEPARLATALADVRTSTRDDLRAVSGLLRSAGRDSTLVAVFGRLQPGDLRELAAAHAGGGSTVALAVLLDADSWSRPADDRFPHRVDPAGRIDRVSAGAAMLRSAGWRVVVVRRGDSVGQAWQLLLAGFGASAAGSLR